MSRQTCSKCQRPIKGCFCRLVSPVHNDVHVVVLQHPTEVGHSKGTLGLLSLSLSNCQVIVGENFNENAELNELLNKYSGHIGVLYPSEISKEITENEVDEPDLRCIILLDATWKKAFKMYSLSTVLQTIPHYHLPDGIIGQYHIRKTTKNNALSTLEACCYSLATIEKNQIKYQALLKSFVQFNQFQLSFRT